MKPRGLRTIYWLAALPLSGLLLYYSLRGIEWARVGQLLAAVYPGWVAAVLGLGVFTSILRAIRWRVLLSGQCRVPLFTVFWANSAGYFGNNLLPARAGELVRTFILSASTNLSKTYVLTTGLSERIADAIALVAISSAVLIFGTFKPGWLGQAAKPFAILGACGLIAILTLPRLESLCRTVLNKLPLSERVRGGAEHALTQIVLGIRSFHNRERLARFVGLTAVIWVTDATGGVLAARALGLSMSLPAAFLLIAGLGLGSALPSTPGYLGVYQFVAVTVLAPFGFSRTDAIAYILFVQLQQYVLITVLGLLGLWQYRKMRQAALGGGLKIPRMGLGWR
jgi:glycosyltransferase 2 family protein